MASITRCDAMFSRRRRDLDVSQVLFRNLGKDERHRAGRVASPSLPRHNRVTDVPKARRWKRLSTGCQRTPMSPQNRRPTSTGDSPAALAPSSRPQ